MHKLHGGRRASKNTIGRLYPCNICLENLLALNPNHIISNVFNFFVCAVVGQLRTLHDINCSVYQPYHRYVLKAGKISKGCNV